MREKKWIETTLAIVVFVCLFLLLTGCAKFDFAANQVADKGAAANDELVKSSRWAICYAASVGSIRREFNTPEEAKIWRQFCSEPGFNLPEDSNFVPYGE